MLPFHAPPIGPISQLAEDTWSTLVAAGLREEDRDGIALGHLLKMVASGILICGISTPLVGVQTEEINGISAG